VGVQLSSVRPPLPEPKGTGADGRIPEYALGKFCCLPRIVAERMVAGTCQGCPEILGRMGCVSIHQKYGSTATVSLRKRLKTPVMCLSVYIMILSCPVTCSEGAVFVRHETDAAPPSFPFLEIPRTFPVASSLLRWWRSGEMLRFVNSHREVLQQASARLPKFHTD